MHAPCARQGKLSQLDTWCGHRALCSLFQSTLHPGAGVATVLYGNPASPFLIANSTLSDASGACNVSVTIAPAFNGRYTFTVRSEHPRGPPPHPHPETPPRVRCHLDLVIDALRCLWVLCCLAHALR